MCISVLERNASILGVIQLVLVHEDPNRSAKELVVELLLCFFQSSLEFPDPYVWISKIVQLAPFSPLRKAPLFQRPDLLSFEVWILLSQCGYLSEQPVPSCFSRDWIFREIAVYEDCDLVDMFLSSGSQCSSGFLTRFTHSLDQMLCCFCKIQSVLGQTRKSHACRSVSRCMFFNQNLILFLRLTPTCLAVSLVT